MSESEIKYWSTLSNDELEETHQSLQKDLRAGWDRKGDTQKWIAEINTVLKSREETR